MRVTRRRPARTSGLARPPFIAGGSALTRAASRAWTTTPGRAGRGGCGRPRRRRPWWGGFGRCGNATRGGGRPSSPPCSTARAGGLRVHGGRTLTRLRATGQLHEPAVVRGKRRWRRRRARPFAQRRPWGLVAHQPGDLVQIDTTPIEVLPGLRRVHFSGPGRGQSQRRPQRACPLHQSGGRGDAAGGVGTVGVSGPGDPDRWRVGV